MSDQFKIPKHVMMELEISTLRMELATAKHATVVAQVERDYGIRVGRDTIMADGTVIKKEKTE